MKKIIGFSLMAFVLGVLVTDRFLGDGKFSFDFSNSKASISTPLTLISPNGGESLQLGSTHSIKWKFANKPPEGTTVSIFLLRSGDDKNLPVTLGLVGHQKAYSQDGSIGVNWVAGQYLKFVDGRYKDAVAPQGSDYMIDIIANAPLQGTVGIDVSDGKFSLVK